MIHSNRLMPKHRRQRSKHHINISIRRRKQAGKDGVMQALPPTCDGISLFVRPQLAVPKCNTRKIELMAIRSSSRGGVIVPPPARRSQRQQLSFGLGQLIHRGRPTTLAFNAAVTVTGLEYCNWPTGVGRAAGRP